MSDRPIQAQLVNYLTDAHSTEEQALQQLRSAPGLAGDPELSEAFRQHLDETERHEQLVRERLEAMGESPSKLKDLVMRAGGAGFLLFARAQPDTPGKLAAHAFSYEHLELAAYELLAEMARRADDEETVRMAEEIRADEEAMGKRLAGLFERAVEASLRELDPDDLDEQLNKYLADAHAIEAQAITLLEKGPKLAGDEVLAQLYSEHLDETREQQRLVDERLEARGGDPSSFKDAAMRAGALNWGTFFQAHPDTPGKLACFAYAFEHLEIGGYQQLELVAGPWRPGDGCHGPALAPPPETASPAGTPMGTAGRAELSPLLGLMDFVRGDFGSIHEGARQSGGKLTCAAFRARLAA
jgi:ferritin-like metal-binding protein YciE